MYPQDGKMHFSNLKKFSQSPAHYATSCEDGFDDSPAMRIGRAVHALVLQDIKPIVFLGAVRRGKEWDSFCEGKEKADILNQSEFETVTACANSVKSNPFAMQLLSECSDFEKEIDGMPCRGRVDAFSETLLVELKTCACASPRKFLYDAHKFSYHAQMSWYDIGLGTQYISGCTNWRDQYIISVETSAPYSCIVFQLDNLRIDQGNTLCEEWLSKFKECEETGIFPSYVTDQPVLWDGEIIIEEIDE
jgi:hypothetical protein